MRLMLPQHADYQGYANTYKFSTLNASNVIFAFNIIDSKIIPQIANKDLIT